MKFGTFLFLVTLATAAFAGASWLLMLACGIVGFSHVGFSDAIALTACIAGFRFFIGGSINSD